MTDETPMKLVRPAQEHLPSYVAALDRGWFPDTIRGAAAAQEELDRIRKDPWKQRRGYASEALRQLLPIIRKEGLPYVELTTDPGNEPSRKVIERNGGIFMGEFTKLPVYGGKTALRYRIEM